jgi:AmmeMemoRadiSam system protein B
MTQAAARLHRSHVAGYWYPQDAGELRREILRLAGPAHPVAEAVGVLLPHGPYDRAGRVGASTAAAVAIPRRCVIFSPTHTGRGAGWSVLAEGAYATPLGEVPIDEALAQAALADAPQVSVDEQAHAGEHGIEALLPLLQVFGPAELQVLPVVTGRADPAACAAVAAAVAGGVRRLGEPVLIIGSVDMTQFEPGAEVARKDAALARALAGLDGEGFERQARASGAAICGAAAVRCALELVRRLGARGGEPIAYATSAETGGDPESATGYLGMMFR